MNLTLWDHLFAILIGLAVLLAGVLQHGQAAGVDTADPPTTREKVLLYRAHAALWAVVTGLALWVWSASGRSLAQLGITAAPDRPAAGLALAALFLVLYAADTWRQVGTPQRLARTRARWRRETPFMPASSLEVRHSLVMVLSAAVFEEVVFRGFLIRYLILLFGGSAGGSVAAVCLPALVFAAGHTYQSLASVVKIALLACLLGATFVLTGSLWIPIALHLVVDLVGALLGPWLLRGDRPHSAS